MLRQILHILWASAIWLTECWGKSSSRQRSPDLRENKNFYSANPADLSSTSSISQRDFLSFLWLKVFPEWGNHREGLNIFLSHGSDDRSCWKCMLHQMKTSSVYKMILLFSDEHIFSIIFSGCWAKCIWSSCGDHHLGGAWDKFPHRKSHISFFWKWQFFTERILSD